MDPGNFLDNDFRSMDIKGLEQRKEMGKVTQYGSTRVKICNSAIRSYLAKLHGF